jgi:hypothetical protein
MWVPVIDVSTTILRPPGRQADVDPEDIVRPECVFRRSGIVELGDLDTCQRQIDLLSDGEPFHPRRFGSKCGHLHLYRCDWAPSSLNACPDTSTCFAAPGLSLMPS